MTKVRCAIYTRKSSDEGLDQEFNSLDAQYGACKAYVASQRHEGWNLNCERYDDGGVSGGTMERPALKRLLDDVATGKVAVIVIYKIDRPTRSLADFARIVELLEKHGASFVSVTQSFNTKTSMGRLMLHVLLVLRPVRARGRGRASEGQDRSLKGQGYVDGRDVATRVRCARSQARHQPGRGRDGARHLCQVRRDQICPGHAALGSACRAKVEGTTKARRGGWREAFQYGSIRCLLSNRLYAGEVEHKGSIYPGQHEAIIDRSLFEEAQAILATLSSSAVGGPKLVSGSLLQGLIVDRHERTMGPVHTKRNGQRFRYYVTHPKMLKEGGPAAYRMSAEAIETACCALLGAHLGQQTISIEDSATANSLTRTLSEGDYRQPRELIIERVRRVTVGDGMLSLLLNDGTTLERSIERVRHGNDAKLVIGEAPPGERPVPDPQLIVLLREAQRARALALSKPALSLQRLAQKFGRSPERYKRLLRLSYLSPAIVAAVLEARQPAHLTNRYLQNLDGLPHDWASQEAMLLR